MGQLLLAEITLYMLYYHTVYAVCDWRVLQWKLCKQITQGTFIFLIGISLNIRQGIRWAVTDGKNILKS